MTQPQENGTKRRNRRIIRYKSRPKRQIGIKRTKSEFKDIPYTFREQNNKRAKHQNRAEVAANYFQENVWKKAKHSYDFNK